MSLRSLGNRLYRGETSVPVVWRSKRWYAISAVLLVVAIGSLLFRGLELGVEFSGGADLRAQVEETTGSTVDDVRSSVTATGIDEAAEPRVTVVGDDVVRVEIGTVTPEESNVVRDAMAEELGIEPGAVTSQVIGPSWGAEITQRALLGLALFLSAVVIFLAVTYEWKMAVGAMAALVHDIVFTVGIYALVGFDVTPATVIGFLTILGYSLYDTVVVFDKVRENTKGITVQNKLTYPEAANLAVNQTLMRSLNTSIIALLPIGSILFVGAGILGAGTLKDLALALFVGVAVGTYSSVFIATPVLVDLKNREPALVGLARRVEARRSGRDREREPRRTPVGATAGASAGRGGGPVVESGERRQPQRRTRAQRKGR